MRDSVDIEDRQSKSRYMVYRLGVDWAANGNVWQPGTFAVCFKLEDAMASAGFPERVKRRIRAELLKP